MPKSILRLNFTQTIYDHYILKGKSLNIFGAKGTGKSRFLEDLALLIDKDIHFATLNMRELRRDYTKFVKQLKKQLSIDFDSQDIEVILDRFAKQESKKVLVLDQFEYLFDDHYDPRFDFEFFDQLNSFKNSDSVSLIIISTRNYSHYHFYRENELTTSPLDLEVMEITPLMQQEVEEELGRKIDKDLGFRSLASMILGRETPYHRMQFIIREIAFGRYNDSEFLERNFDWFERQFIRENRVPWYTKVLKWVKKLNPETVIGGITKVIKAWKS